MTAGLQPAGVDWLVDLAHEANAADLVDAPCLVVDLEGAPAMAPARMARLRDWSRRQALPLVGLARLPVADGLAAIFDVVVSADAELQLILQTIGRQPRAATVLVQVLRATEGLDIPSALVVESLGYATLLGGGEFATWLAARDPRYAQVRSRPADPVRLHREGDVLHVTLDHPHSRNALSAAMRDALADAFRLVLMDASIAAVTLQGNGPGFCAGGDLSEFGTQRDLSEGHYIRSLRMPAQYLAACADRVHTRVHGACIGAGIELAAFSRRLTAAPDTRFRLPEIAMGLIPGAGGCVSIPRRIGRQRAAFMALCGQDVAVDTALSWGLIDAVER